MPKQKTHKGLAKRVKVSANGKIKRKHSCGGHLMSGKSGKRRRSINKTLGIDGALARNARIALGK